MEVEGEGPRYMDIGYELERDKELGIWILDTWDRGCISW